MGDAMNKHIKPDRLTPEEIEMASLAKAAFYSKRGTQQSTSCTCIDAVEEIIFLRANDFVTQMEMADPRDRWRHTGELPPAAAPESPSKKEYRTPQGTIDAFFGWVVRQDQAYQSRWLAEHPRDEAYLRKLWEDKCKPQSK
jgi:hypothetical protein